MGAVHILNQTTSIANRYLFELRDKQWQTDRMRFRKNLERLGSLMAYEISKTLKTNQHDAQTPLGIASIELPNEKVILVTVLRAGLPFYNGFAEVLDHEDSGFIGAYRGAHQGTDITIDLNYAASPKLEGTTLVLIDPMLATGKSIIKTLEALGEFGKPNHIHIASVIASPEGINYLQRNIQSAFSIWIWAQDERLNENAYIVPGLGDAGDLSFGSKV